jgi:hypothetical protein
MAWRVAEELVAEEDELRRVEALTDEEVAREVREIGVSVPSTEGLLARVAERAAALAKGSQRRLSSGVTQKEVAVPRALPAPSPALAGRIVDQGRWAAFRRRDTSRRVRRAEARERARGPDRGAKERRRGPGVSLRASWVLGAIAVGGLIGFAVSLTRPATAGHGEARRAEVADAGSLLVEHGVQLREKATAACEAGRFDECQTALDHAMLVDPVGDGDPRVRRMREAIRKARWRPRSGASSTELEPEP